MKNLKLYLLTALAAGCATMIGCSKKSSSTPTTPTSGSDSVIYSNWTPLQMQGNIDNNNDTFYSQTITAKAITHGVLDHGMVVGYVEGLDNNNDTLFVNASTLMSENFYVGSIYLESDPFLPSPSAGVDYSGFNYRYVIIPGNILTTGTATGTQTYTPDQIKSMDYPTIAKIFHLPSNDLPSRTGKVFQR